MAKLTHRTIFTLNPGHGPRVRPEGATWATVIYGLREWPVALETTPLRFGGHRRWLVCPECSSRREALFVTGDRLACRACLGLRYASQHENRRSRMIRRANKIRAQLGWIPGILMPSGGRPKGMRLVTYVRLRAEIDQLTDELMGNLVDWLERADARLDRMGR